MNPAGWCGTAASTSTYAPDDHYDLRATRLQLPRLDAFAGACRCLRLAARADRALPLNTTLPSRTTVARVVNYVVTVGYGWLDSIRFPLVPALCCDGLAYIY